MQKTVWAVMRCIHGGIPGEMNPALGRSQQLFVCVFSHFRHGDKQSNNQPVDPRASLLLTSEKVVFCNFRMEGGRAARVDTFHIVATINERFRQMIVLE